jgi:DNA invertase Pin-like site-specific DNA recombinase
MENKENYKIGYARVSTHEQNLELQLDALNQAGCYKIFQDKTSGTKSEREGLKDAIDYLRAGDVLVVWKLDRLGRSLKHLIELVTGLQERQIGFCSLNEAIDTTTNGGKLIFHIFGALAEFERGLIKERTLAGLVSARARGRKGGRPTKMDKHKIALAKSLMSDKSILIKTICEKLNIGKTTLYKYMKEDI